MENKINYHLCTLSTINLLSLKNKILNKKVKIEIFKNIISWLVDDGTTNIISVSESFPGNDPKFYNQTRIGAIQYEDLNFQMIQKR